MKTIEPFIDSNLRKAGRGLSHHFMPRTCPDKSKIKRKRFGGQNLFRMRLKNQLIKLTLNKLQRDPVVALAAYALTSKKEKTSI